MQTAPSAGVPAPAPPLEAPPPELERSEPSLPAIRPPPSPRPGPPAAWTLEPFPGTVAVLQASAGFLLLGLAGAAGKGAAQAALLVPPLILGLAVLPGLIATPALIVLHQHRGLAASPSKLLQALTEAWMEAGRLAGGLASVVLFFALTSMMGTELMIYGLALAGWLGLNAARRRLRDVEHAAGGNVARFGTLLWSWTLLTTLIGARLTWIAVHWLQGLGR